ncbi:ATP-binding cassette domain-containing protein [Niabella aurantiaca]|uniref:ABC transporter ATP-binding protein n=1 Tax=Niabella aurantiaca TaxID=379900 RepID=UPI00037549B9|nr:ATP-binding cassette domain-containing protein [Niabella aurantiaca]
MIALKNISFAYKKTFVLKELTTTFNTGQIYGLLGDNGAGKTTLLKLMSGLLFPGTGKITVQGSEPQQRRPSFLQSVFFVADNIFFPGISIPQYIEGYAPFYPQFSKKQFIHCLTAFNIGYDNDIEALSFGQKKKLLLCFALAANTPYLFLDEPTNGLDIPSRAAFKELLSGHIDDRKCVIVSTHQVNDLGNLLDHVSILQNGKLAFSQSMEQISRQLLFDNATSPDAEILFAEESLRGRTMLTKNDSGYPSGVDLELLYKAVTINGERINQLFAYTENIAI